MNLQIARQTLAELIDERNKRHQATVDAERKRRSALQRLSALRAQQELDGVDLTKRIDQAQREITDCDAIVNVWSDVESELTRRIDQAQQAVKAAQVADLVSELDALKQGELADRRRFAESLYAFAVVAAEVNERLQRKMVLKRSLVELGRAVDAGDDQLPHWNRFGVGHRALIEETAALVATYR